MNRFNSYASAALFLIAGAVLYSAAATAQAPAVSIAPASQTVNEGGNAVFTVTVHGTAAMPTTATYSITGVGISGSAQPADIGAPGTTTPLEMFLSAQKVRIEAGADSTATITIPVLRDGRNEAVELFAVRLTGAEGGATALSGDFFAIVEIGASADFILSLQGPAGAVEGDTAEYDFLISGDAPVSALQVPYDVAVGGAASPADLQILTPGAVPFDGAPPTASGYLAIAAGSTAGTLLIRIADDGVAETVAESIQVSVGAAPFLGNNGVFPIVAAERSVQTTLTDPSAGRVLLSAGPDAPVAEGATATFTVRVAGTTADVTTATWIVSGFGANPASAADFAGGEFPSGEITIDAGANPSAAMELSILDDDSLPEGEETFRILLTDAGSDGTVALASNSMLVGAIAADGVVIAGPPAEVAEGGEAVFIATARGRTTQNTVATWSLLPGASSPASPDDFGDAANSAPLAAFPSSRTVTIAAGLNRTAEIRIPVFNDAENEDAETFSVSLIGAAGGMTATGPPPRDTASATIAESNDDFTFTFSGPSAVVEGDVAEYTLQLRGGDALAQDLVAAYIIDSATSPTTVDGNDYQVLAPAGFGGHGASNRNLTIPAGGDRAVVRIRFIADSVAEAATETLAVFVDTTAFQGNGGVFPLPASGVSAGDPNRVGVDVVINEPPARRVILDAGPAAPVAEGASAAFSVRIPGAGSATTVQYAVTGSGDNPASAADFAGGVLPSGSVVIAEGVNSSATIALPIAADFTTEEQETFTLTLTGATAESTEQPTLSANPSREAAIAADAVGAFSLSGPAAPVAEGANAAFSVRLSGAINGDAQVRYRVTGTAPGLQPADFGRGLGRELPEGVLTLAAGTDSSVTLEIPVHDDDLNEAAETFEVRLEPVTAAAGGVTLRLASTAGAAVVIADNDPILATLTAPAQMVSEGDNAVFAVELSGGARDANLTMAWQTTQTGTTNSAEAGDFGDRAAAADFPSGTLTFAPGDSRMTAAVPVFKDFVTEGAETFVFELERAVGAAGEAPAAMTATATIAASDSRDRIFAATGPDSIAEGTTAMYSIVLESGAAVAAGGLTLNWAIEARGAPAANADDFITTQAGSVIFAEGDAVGTSRSIAVSVADDALAEGRETFALVFDETMVGVRQAPVTAILDDDEITIALSGGGATSESFSVSFTVALGGSTRQNAAAIPWRIAADTTATTADADAADYEPDSGFFIVAPGATTAMVSVTAVDDEVTERAEVFVMHLDEAARGAGVSRLLNSSQSATIARSDPRQVVFERTGYLVIEGAPGAANLANPRLRFEPPGTAGEDVTVRLAPLSLGVPAHMGVDAGAGDYRFFNAAGDTELPANTANTRVTLPAGETGAPAKIAIPHVNGYETTRTLGLVIDDALIGGTSASGLVTAGEASTTGITIQEDDFVVAGFFLGQHDFVEDTRASPAFFFRIVNDGASRFAGQPPLRIVFIGSVPEVQRDTVVPSIPSLGDVVTRTYGFETTIEETNFAITDDLIGLEDSEEFNLRILTHAEARELGEQQDPRVAANFAPHQTTVLRVLDNEFVRENRWRLNDETVRTTPIRVSESQGTLSANQAPLLSNPSVRDLDVRWETGAAPGAAFDAVEGRDYRLTTSTSIRRGTQVSTFAARVIHPPLVLIDDDVAEEDKAFNLSYGPGQVAAQFVSGLRFMRTARTIIIEDDDDIRVDFERAEYTLTEGETEMICVVVPGYSLNRTVTASVTVNSITARRGADYTLTGDGRLADFTSSASAQRRCLNLEILDDVIAEPDEVFELSLQFDDSTGSRVASARPVATVTIDDEDPVGFGLVSSFYADVPETLGCRDCGEDERIVYQLANPVVSGATFSFDAQARLTPPDGAAQSAFLSQTTFGIAHDAAVLNNCRAARAGLTATRDNGFYAQTAMAAATGTTAWTFTAAGAGAYAVGDAAANRTRFGELTTDYRDLLRVECDIADSATRTDVGIAAVGWSGLRTLVASGRDRGHLAYAGNRFDDIATNGDPWAVEVNLYGDGRRADLVMSEPLQGPVSSATFAHTGGGVSVTAAALAQASSRIIELALSGDSAGGAVAVAAGRSLTAGDGATLAAGYHLAQLPAHDNAAPEMTSASLENNDTVRLAFSPDFNAAAVSTADFVLTVLNPDGITGAEVVSLATDANTTVTLVLRTLGGGVVQDGVVRSANGAETLQIRLARNFAGDITDNVADAEDHPAETHQTPSQALAFGDNLRPTLLEFTAVNRTSSSGGYNMNFRARFSERVSLQNSDIRVLEVSLVGENTGGAVVTNVDVAAMQQSADAASATYTITLGPLTPAQYPAAGSGYAVELIAAAIADDAGNTLFPAEDRRATMGGHNRRGVFHTTEDFNPPTLLSAALDDANENLTLTFSEPVQIDTATGSIADIEITDSPGGWITTAALTSLPALPAEGSTEVRFAFAAQGPPPLNGASPEGRERARITLLTYTGDTGVRWRDATGNLLASGETADFGFNDNAAPVIAAVSGQTGAVAGGTTRRMSWTVTFTEPVTGVVANSFDIYTLASSTASVSDALSRAGADAFAGADFQFTAGASTAGYTVELAEPSGAPRYYLLATTDTNVITEAPPKTRALGGVVQTGPDGARGVLTLRDETPPVLTGASLDFPAGGNRATATLVFNEAVVAAMMSDFEARTQIVVTTSSEWIGGAALAGAAVADGARLHIPLQTTGAAPVNGGSPDGGEAVTIVLAAGAVSDGMANANRDEYRRQLVFPENAPPQLRLRTAGATSAPVPDFRRHRVAPEAGGTRMMTWRLRFTEAVAGVSTHSFTLWSAPEVADGDDLDALADSLTSDAGVMNLATSAAAASSFTAAPVTEAPAVVMTSGSIVYSDTWELTAAGLSARNIMTTTLAHYIVRLEQTAAAARIGDDEGRSFANDAPPRPVWSEAQPAGDVNAPQVAAAALATAVPGNPSELLLQVTIEDALTTASAATFMNNFGVRDRNGAVVAPAGAFATVTGMELVRYGAATDVRVAVGENQTTLTFRARLTGTLDNGESAVGGERFRFTIPGGRLTDLFGNTQADDTTFTAGVPESGAPEVAEFSVLSSVERAPNAGVFDLRYLLAFTEPVEMSSAALTLYSAPGRNQPPARAAATPIGSVLNGALATAVMPSSVASSGSQARYIVAYHGVRRPARDVRGYAIFLRDTGATESMAPMNKTLEDCPYYETDRAMTGCLSASADVSDVSPPRLQGAGYAGSRLWLQFDEPARALSAGAELADGDALEGFEVLPGHRMGQMTSGGIVVERALYRVASTQSGASRVIGVELELDTVIQGTETAVWVRYTPPAAGAGIYDNADLRGLNAAPNRIVQTLELQVAEGLTDDSDGDGIPDATEIALGGNPLAPLTDAERAALPQVVLSRGVSDIAHIAYSGIRALGAAAHLGIGTTGAAAASRAAYYLTDTFGYTPAPGEPAYACTERFPANYRAPVARGGCAVVDFADIRPGVEHRIGWLAVNAAGYWLAQGTSSTLMEQRIVRVPELNMNAERLFFLAADADSATVTVEAEHDGPEAAADLTLAFTTGQSQTGRKAFSFTVAKSAVSASRTWGIAGLSGGGASLWRAGTDTAGLTANSYSLGLTTQTTVVRLGDDSLPPTVGSPVLFSGAGRGDADVRSVLSAGGFAVRLPVENPHASLAPAVTATGAGAAALTALSAMRSGGHIEVALTVAAVTTPTSVTLRISAPGRGATATVTASWPIVPSAHALADMAAGDGDRDGIADDSDLYEDNSGLPVAVLDTDASLAGADSWHHIRPVLPGQSVRVGAATLRRAAEREDLVSGAAAPYDTYAASFFDIEGFAVVYDFSVYDVDYSSQPAQNPAAATVAGGRAGVIIPLPESLYDDAGLGLFKYREDGAPEPFAASPGGNDYGFAPLANGACPDDTGAADSPYRDGGGGLRRPKSGGDACLVVYVADGGVYDEDEALPNGVVHDPLGLRAGAVGGGGTATGGSGSFGIAGLLMLLFGALCLFLRRRFPNAARGAGGETA